jgi:hypothetical protein
MHELLGWVADIIVKDAPDVSQPLTFTTDANSIDMAEFADVLAVLIITDAGTGCVVTLEQGDDATADTALAFTKYWYKADIATSNAWVEGTASSNTFTTGTDSKTGIYAIPIKDTMLTAGYRFARMNCASTANATGTLFYVPSNGRYPSDAASMVDASS